MDTSSFINLDDEVYLRNSHRTEEGDKNGIEELGRSAGASISVEQDFQQNNSSSIKAVIEATLKEMSECEDPTTIISSFQKKILQGRDLDIINENEGINEGNTNPIFISRFELFETGMSELTTDEIDLRLPLEVTYYGEKAQDHGGPRKEFLASFMRAIKDKLFKELNEEMILMKDPTFLNKKYYLGAGRAFAASITQNGPLPCFLQERLITDLIDGDDTSDEYIKQLRDGLNNIGLIELMKKKPTLRFLFRKGAVKELNYRRLMMILEPSFSEAGSNARLNEEKCYQTFVSYVKEVAAGRRGPISLETILRFTTACEAEPLLGFNLKPRIEFSNKDTEFPEARTCTNVLYLPLHSNPEKDAVFSKYDLAFANNYFGFE